MPHLPPTWAANGGFLELDIGAAMHWSRAHTDIALWGCAAVVAGELLGLIVGGIREVWLWLSK